MRKFIHWVATVATMTFLVPAQANQNDARLPGLFDQLREARSTKDAAQVEQAIWQVWLLSGNLTADAHVHRGLQALSDGRNKDALVDFTKATEVQADFSEAWNKRATVNYLLGRYDAAVLDIQKTLELEPRHFGALFGLGLINLALGREREALRAFEAALRIHPLMPGAKTPIRELRDRVQGKRI